MNKLLDFLIEKPIWVLLSLSIVTVFLGMGLTKLEVKNNQDSELPENDEVVRTNDYLKEIFGKKDILMIGVETEDVFTKTTLKKLIDIADSLKNIDGILENEITSLASVNTIQGKEWGLEVGPFMEKTPENNATIQALKKEAHASQLISGKLVAKNSQFTVIIANMDETYDQAKVTTQVEAMLEKFKGEEKFYLAGSPINQHEVDAGIEKDINALLPLSLLFLLIGYFLSFRTIKGVLLPFSIVILSIVWTMGLMGHLGFPVTVVSSIVPVIMIAISSSYGIHILHRYYEEITNGKTRKEAAREAIKKITPALLMTGMTSALGSATLIIFKVTSIQEFGIITALGMICVLVTAVLFIPSILALSKKTTDRKLNTRDQFFDRFLVGLADFSLLHKGKILIVTLAMLIIAGIGITQIRTGIDFIKYFPKDHQLTTSFNKFNNQLGGARVIDIMVEANEAEMIKHPRFLKKIDEFQRFAEAQEGVGYSNSFADIIKQINKEMQGGKEEFYTIPNDENTVAQYLLLYSMSGDPSNYNDLVDYDYQRAKIKLFLTTSDQDDHQLLYTTLKNYAANHFGNEATVAFGGEAMFWLAQVKYIVTGKIQNIILAILVVMLFCMFVLRSIAAGLLSIVPLTVSSILTFGVMGFMNIRLDVGTAIITAIGIGIGVDFAIHYLLRFQEEINISGDLKTANRETILTSGKAIIYDVVSNILGFIVFVFSGFLQIQYFGWLISLTMITVAFGTLVFFPALIALFKPKLYTKAFQH